MGLFMNKGENTRLRIVKEAAALLNQRGFEGLAYSDLMAATGLEKGGIYRHFPGKQELAEEAFQYAWKTAVEHRQQNLQTIENTVDWLKGFVSNFVHIRPGIPGGCPLLNAAIDTDDGNAALRKHAERALRGWLSALTRVIRRGQRRREIHAEADAARTARLLVATLEGALMISRLERKPAALSEAEWHLHAVCESLRA
jgi:TetR/AcrR family transcriptional repressor of nem operon